MTISTKSVIKITLKRMFHPFHYTINSCVKTTYWRRKWQPTPAHCLENSMDRGALWATIHGVAKSWT